MMMMYVSLLENMAINKDALATRCHRRGFKVKESIKAVEGNSTFHASGVS